MEQPTGRPSSTKPAEIVPRTASKPQPLDQSRGVARMPDFIAELSYGTRVLARPGGGPRIF